MKRFLLSLAAIIGLMVVPSVVFASDVDVAVVDVTAPTGSVTLIPGGSGNITINLSVSGNQAGTATFEIYRDWTLSGDSFTGSNPQEFTVPPRAGGAPATTFSTSGTVSVAAGQANGTFTLAVGAFDITNSNSTGAKLEAGDLSNYSVTVESPVVADTTPPVVNCTVPDQAVWYASNVTVNCTATDVGTPPAVPAAFALSTDVAAGAETATAATGTQQVCDSATPSANCTTSGPYTFKVDRKGPSVSCQSPAPSFILNQSGATVSASVTDGGSGAAASSVSASADTSSVGSKTVSLTGMDNVGNSTQASCSYNVVFAVCVLYDQGKSHKAGSTVPIKLQLCDASGNNVSSADIVVTALSLAKQDNNASPTVEDAGQANSPDYNFRFDDSLDGYIFNLSTKQPTVGPKAALTTGTYVLSFSVDGATGYSVKFDVK